MWKLQSRIATEAQPRRGDICIAWGVSPRNGYVQYERAPEGGDRHLSEMTAAHGAATVCRPSRALVFWGRPNPGLTPRAMNLSPLRGSCYALSRYLKPSNSLSEDAWAYLIGFRMRRCINVQAFFVGQLYRLRGGQEMIALTRARKRKRAGVEAVILVSSGF